MKRRLVSELYWSRIGAPLRALFPRPPAPASDALAWDSQVSGIFAPRLGGTLSIDTRNQVIGQMIAHTLVDEKARSVMDIGCGGGTLQPVLARLNFGEYHGFDISPKAIDVARARFAMSIDEAKFWVTSIDDLVPSQSYDVIVFSEMLYYTDFRRTVSLVMKFKPYLKPGGAFVISMNLVNPKARAIQRSLTPHLHYLTGSLWQEKTQMDHKVRFNHERPLYHAFLCRPK